jgi:hypothetical protein
VYGLSGAAFSVFVLLVFEIAAGFENGHFWIAEFITIGVCFLVPFGLAILIKREFAEAFADKLDALRRKGGDH